MPIAVFFAIASTQRAFSGAQNKSGKLQGVQGFERFTCAAFSVGKAGMKGEMRGGGCCKPNLGSRLALPENSFPRAHVGKAGRSTERGIQGGANKNCIPQIHST